MLRESQPPSWRKSEDDDDVTVEWEHGEAAAGIMMPKSILFYLPDALLYRYFVRMTDFFHFDFFCFFSTLCLYFFSFFHTLFSYDEFKKSEWEECILGICFYSTSLLLLIVLHIFGTTLQYKAKSKRCSEDEHFRGFKSWSSLARTSPR